MKKSILMFAVLAIAAIVGLNSCGKGDIMVDPNTDMVVSQVLPDGVMPVFDANSVDVYGSIEEQINCYPEFNGNREGGDMGRMGNRMKERMGFGFKMRDIFFRLQLDANQREAMGRIMQDYHDCVKGVMSQTEDRRKEILAAAAIERKAKIEEFKTGTNPDNDTREELGLIIKVINERVRTSLQELIDQDALCECFTKMLRQTFAQLSEKQKALFIEWLKKQKHPCLPLDFDPNSK
jgi:hypothetical protein